MDSYDQAFLFSMRSLGKRAQFASEINLKLMSRGFSEEVREEVLKRLRELGYLDDEAVSKRVVQSELGKGRSLRAAFYKLKQKGGALPEGDWEEEERRSLCRFVEKKRGLMATEEGRQRLIRSLLRRGHSIDEIQRALEAVN